MYAFIDADCWSRSPAVRSGSDCRNQGDCGGGDKGGGGGDKGGGGGDKGGGGALTGAKYDSLCIEIKGNDSNNAEMVDGGGGGEYNREGGDGGGEYNGEVVEVVVEAEASTIARVVMARVVEVEAEASTIARVVMARVVEVEAEASTIARVVMARVVEVVEAEASTIARVVMARVVRWCGGGGDKGFGKSQKYSDWNLLTCRAHTSSKTSELLCYFRP